ncbi:PIG-L family deacetylase [Nocardioides sambongensis]|uniref:PIG-L family deacetylase n=1 Tax=Nocardioides sambongensis TaxID=2589074 RepID=UPI00112EA1A7|nr:PIG-L family deacetylase [Nocardioides sambongensis]
MSARSFTAQDRGSSPTTWRQDPRWHAAPTVDLGGIERVVVLAAHPDDETLGAGGIAATLAARGVPVTLVLATAGEASHPASPTHSPQRLAQRRLRESAAALAVVAPAAHTVHLDLVDGAVATREEELVHRLVRVVGDGRSTLLLSPWREDGHPDHEACGRAAAVGARRTGARLLQYPIWCWQWATPQDLPWELVRLLPLGARARAAKAGALAQHSSQVRPLSPAAGDEQLLPDHFLEHFAGPEEVFLAEAAADDALDDLHRRSADPWRTGSDYERRKRALTLAALPRPRYGRALEIGCSVGALAEDLADRCDHLLAVDASGAAVDAATERLAATDRADDAAAVRVEQRSLPRDWDARWQAEPFDLVVVSEVGYFLSPGELEELVERLRGGLAPDGDLLLCHWRHPIHGWPLDGAAVHERFREGSGLPVVAEYRDRDAEILVLSARPLPGAQP